MSDLSDIFEKNWNKVSKKYKDNIEIRDLCNKFFEIGVKVFKPENEVISFADFEEWWNLYDKKCGRSDCLKKWSRLKPEEQKACIKATPAYVSSTPDKQYRKNPLSFLNQKAWNDEIIQNKSYGHAATDTDRADKLSDILVG